jgi:hypothetical protein
LGTAASLASVATAKLGYRRRCGDLLPLKQHAEWHLHDTAAAGAASVYVREAALFEFSEGAIAISAVLTAIYALIYWAAAADSL